MKKGFYLPAFIILGLALFIQSCEIEVDYDITVINDTDYSFSVYLDDLLQFKLAAGGSSIIRNVDSGRHIIDARADGEIIAERILTLDKDIEWTVYVARYEITVINETNFRFSVYLDGVFQFDLRPGFEGTIIDVSEGTHTLDAREGSEIVATDTFFVDQDTEWTVY